MIGLLSHAIHKHSSGSQHNYICVNYMHIYRQVCTIEPAFFNTNGDASSSHRGSTSSCPLVWLRDHDPRPRLALARVWLQPPSRAVNAASSVRAVAMFPSCVASQCNKVVLFRQKLSIVWMN